MTKEEYIWNRFGVPLARLVEFDEVSAANALADAFGDSYLYCHNPVYASVRDAAIGFGYGFSPEDTPLWRDYQSFSLTVLHRILTGKTIPYLDTGTICRRLIEENPQAQYPLGLISENLKRNHSFHESAHCVAHSIMRAIGNEMRAAAPREADCSALEAILAESFANTVEALGTVFQHMPVLDRVFYSLNSYFSPNPRSDDLLNRADAELGAELRFTLLFLGYFEANLATEGPADSTCERIAEAGGCGSQARIARETAGMSFRRIDLLKYMAPAAGSFACYLASWV
jgi:hypothetical protein